MRVTRIVKRQNQREQFATLKQRYQSDRKLMEAATEIDKSFHAGVTKGVQQERTRLIQLNPELVVEGGSSSS